MPTYDYKCSNCGHTFEEFHSISAEPLKVCPKCGKETLKRILGSGVGMIFKGGGFYQTDYKKSGDQKAAEKPKTEKKTEEKKSESSTEKSPSTKSESKS